RIVEGKGARAQFGTIYGGDSPSFVVEPDKLKELKMGAPFTIDFAPVHDGLKVRIDGSRIFLRESSGCAIAELHGMSVVPEVFSARSEDGKGSKAIGKFVRFTDSELLTNLTNKLPDLGLYMATMPVPAGAKDSLVFEATLPMEGMKVGLEMKKHPLFGRLVSSFK
ncbi:MAG: hypothetical protein ABL997_15350, partial [Planctomycetota bacterium]